MGILASDSDWIDSHRHILGENVPMTVEHSFFSEHPNLALLSNFQDKKFPRDQAELELICTNLRQVCAYLYLIDLLFTASGKIASFDLIPVSL